jgi:hypothetical protein
MRYYLDTEFDEKRAQLISIGLVAQNGREFYAVNESYDQEHMSDWLKEHVKPLLYNTDVIDASTRFGRTAMPSQFVSEQSFNIARDLVDFIGPDHDVEFWGYKCAWDIVLVHRLFGGYSEISEAGHPIPLTCSDLTQLARSLGIESLKEKVPPFEPAHHALVDARWNKHVHEQIIIQYGRNV